MQTDESTIAYYRRRLAAMRTERTAYESDWRDVSEYMQPRRGRWFNETPTDVARKRPLKIINSSATLAARTLKSGLMGSLTSPARPWFRLTTPDPGMMEWAQAKQWLYVVESRMRDILSKSNLYTALPSLYEELALFGQAPMLAANDLTKVIRFFPYTVGSYCLATGANATIDTLAREYKMTVRAVVDEFGIGRVSENVRRMYESRQYDAWVDVVQFISPNRNQAPGKADYRGMAWSSCYFEASCDDHGKTLREAGFRSFPIMAPRWEVATPEDIYGYGPGLQALGDCKQLQFNERRKATAVDKFIEPSMVAPASMRRAEISTVPGGISYATAETQTDKFRTAYELDARGIQIIGADNDMVARRIDQVFFKDLFLMLAGREGPQMTAEEIIRRQEEKVHQIGPILERLNSELLGPLIDRTFDLMLEHPDQLVPPPPRELEGVKLNVDYISALAQAQKLVGSTGIERFASFVGGLSSIDPSVMDKWDLDQTVDQYANVNGVPPDIVRSDEQVAELRQQRQQQQQMMQMAAAAKPMADAAGAVKSLSEAAPTPDSVLGRMGQAAAAAVG